MPIAQVWIIPGSGEAKLVLSWFHGQVEILTKSVELVPFNLLLIIALANTYITISFHSEKQTVS